MIKLFIPEEEDNRRLGRERKNPDCGTCFPRSHKGVLFSQGIEVTSLCIVIAIDAWMKFELEMVVPGQLRTETGLSRKEVGST